LESVVDPRCIIDKKRLCGPQRVYACIGWFGLLCLQNHT
jgi:hypothetical protein